MSVKLIKPFLKYKKDISLCAYEIFKIVFLNNKNVD